MLISSTILTYFSIYRIEGKAANKAGDIRLSSTSLNCLCEFIAKVTSWYPVSVGSNDVLDSILGTTFGSSPVISQSLLVECVLWIRASSGVWYAV